MFGLISIDCCCYLLKRVSIIWISVKRQLEDIRKKKLEIVLTTHETCREHIEELIEIKWSGIIVDEVFYNLRGLLIVFSSVGSINFHFIFTLG